MTRPREGANATTSIRTRSRRHENDDVKPFMQQPMPAMSSPNAALNSGAQRAREYRERLTAAAMAAHVLPGDKTMTEHHAAVEIVTRLSWHCGSPRPGAVM